MRVFLRVGVAICLCVLVGGCGVFAGRGAAADPTEAVYRAAMADFSDCGTATDPAERATLSARLAEAAARLQAETRPSNADHFYMADRVAAAAENCAELAAR